MLRTFGFTSIALLSSFFSYQPRMFIRIFVPREEWKEAARSILRNPSFLWAMRVMAFFQFGLAAIFGAAW